MAQLILGRGETTASWSAMAPSAMTFGLVWPLIEGLLGSAALHRTNVDFMGVESGGWGDASPAVQKSAGDVPPRNDDILASFVLDIDEYFAFSSIFKIKWPKSEEKLNFGGRWDWVPMNPSPQTKLRGDAPG